MTDEERRREIASRTTYETIQSDCGWLAIATVDDRSCAAGGATEAEAKRNALQGVAGPSNAADFVGHMVCMSAREVGYFEPDTCRTRSA
jgi:hypothetical protein